MLSMVDDICVAHYKPQGLSTHNTYSNPCYGNKARLAKLTWPTLTACTIKFNPLLSALTNVFGYTTISLGAVLNWVKSGCAFMMNSLVTVELRLSCRYLQFVSRFECTGTVINP